MENDMNFELQTPEHVISLASSGLIVHVDVNVWSATKQDKRISNEVTEAYKADADAGRFTKNLLAKNPHHKALVNYRQTINNWLQRRAYDWQANLKYLPVVDIEVFMKEYREHETEFRKLVETFKTHYPSIRSDMAFKQGDFFNASDYPEVEEIDGKFRIKLYVTEVPTNDFRNKISEEIMGDLKEHFQKQAKSKVDEIMTDAAGRLVTFAERISYACGEPEDADEVGEDGKKKRKRKIYETTIQQTKDLCRTLKDFNLTNNAELEDARARLAQALDGIDAETLRDSMALRDSVKAQVDDVLDVFKLNTSLFN
jgi:hypothetical protein